MISFPSPAPKIVENKPYNIRFFLLKNLVLIINTIEQVKSYHFLHLLFY